MLYSSTGLYHPRVWGKWFQSLDRLELDAVMVVVPQFAPGRAEGEPVKTRNQRVERAAPTCLSTAERCALDSDEQRQNKAYVGSRLRERRDLNVTTPRDRVAPIFLHLQH